jgi:hypothetical protein
MRMKVLLCQTTPTGRVEIARSRDGSFHVLWAGRSIARTATLTDALKAAARPPAGHSSEADWLVSDQPASWFMSDAA